MTFEDVQRKNAENRRQDKNREMGKFVKWVNDKDQKLVMLTTPFEGFNRELLNQKDGTVKLKVHYRMHVLAEINPKTNEGVGSSKLTIEDVRRLLSTTEDAKIATAPKSMRDKIRDLVDEKCSIFLITRNGAPNSTDTTYEVMAVKRLDDNEVKALVPNISRDNLLKLQSEVQWKVISNEERAALENLGGGED